MISTVFQELPHLLNTKVPYTIHADGLHAAAWSQNKLYSQYFLQAGITSSVINVCNFYFPSHHYKNHVLINLQF
jgi:hypothetical protein